MEHATLLESYHPHTAPRMSENSILSTPAGELLRDRVPQHRLVVVVLLDVARPGLRVRQDREPRIDVDHRARELLLDRRVAPIGAVPKATCAATVASDTIGRFRSASRRRASGILPGRRRWGLQSDDSEIRREIDQ